MAGIVSISVDWDGSNDAKLFFDDIEYNGFMYGHIIDPEHENGEYACFVSIDR